MIYDCFIFFNELDLLEIRLNILNEVVDRFVLVEATRTFQGNSKPLYYYENKKRFEKFEKKIIHIIVDTYPTFFSKWRKPTAWDIEEHQRNQISKGLINCTSSDRIIVSDLDEIPNPEEVKNHKVEQGIKVFKQKNFYFFLNCLSRDGSERDWYGPVLARYGDFKKPQSLRRIVRKLNSEGLKVLENKFYRIFRGLSNSTYRNKISIIENGGWHFGFLGGVKKIIEKLEAFSHEEFNKEEFKNEEFILEAISSGKDFLGRGINGEFILLDETFPPYILQNLDKYSHLINNYLTDI